MNLLYLTIKALQSAFDQTWIAKLLAIVLAYFMPLSTYVHFLIFLLLIDAFTSIYYQAKVKIKERKMAVKEVSFLNGFIIFFKTIESSRLRTTIEKMVAYVIWLIICFMFDKIVFKTEPLKAAEFNYFSITNVAVLMMCLTELTSISANMSKITNNPIFKSIIKIFKKKNSGNLDLTDETQRQEQ